MRDEDEPAHLRRIEIPAAVLTRWIETATWLAKVDVAVLTELRDLERDRTPWRLERCVRAARWVETIADEPYRSGARALAVEIQEMRRRSHLSEPRHTLKP